MNGVVAAAHGKVAATIVHLAGDPSLDWAAFAAFAHEQGNPEVAALAETLDSFTQWARQLHTEVIEANGRLDTDPPAEKSGTPDPASTEVAEPEEPQVTAPSAKKSREWCPGAGSYKPNEVDRNHTEDGIYNVCPSCGHQSPTARHGMNWTVRRHKRLARDGT